jgi:hypothetical protein
MAMTRKKHTHLSKSEAHAEAVALTADAAETAAGQSATEAKPDGDASAEPNRFRRIAQSAEELAKKRLHGTRAELLLDTVPARLEKALDALLDRVGLVRKSKLEGYAPAAPAPSAAEAQPA